MSLLSDAASPYLLYIKIAAAVLAAGAVIGAGLYVRHVFADRARLQEQTGALTAQLVTEQQRYKVAMEQLAIWQDTVNKMNQAIKQIRIQSDTYITGVENEKKPVLPAAGAVFILPGVPAGPGLSGFENHTTGRNRPPAPPR